MKKDFRDLIELSKRLRDPGGCPWDRKQSLEDLKACILEEAYEVIQAIEQGDIAELKEELGDLLYQVVFASQILHEQGHFGVEDVVADLHDKLVRRHPHVFGDLEAADAAEALRIWQGQKKNEENRKRSIVEIPRGMPALARAQRVGEKASHVGFDWKRREDVLDKLKEEIAELEGAMEAGDMGDDAGVESEWGDVVFTLVNLARFLRMDAEGATHGAVEKFIGRFLKADEKAAEMGKQLQEMSAGEMDELWEDVKGEERG
ncbi:MAG: nucleoside triphosphate pyrophosphohydrolase [Candidatus Dadabacteria bacterium]|nr:nucleoside triphosphate pyrophosphohydrolase [Candidatus Dadabacteria bacterium]